MTKNNVLVLASTFPLSKTDATPAFVFNLEKRLTSRFNIYLLAPHAHLAKKKETLSGIKVYRYQYFWPSSWQKLCYGGGVLPNLKSNPLLIVQVLPLIFFQLWKAIIICHQQKIELIHAHWAFPQGLIAALLKITLKIPYIISVHGGEIYGIKSPLIRRLINWVLYNSRYITTVSHALKNEMIKAYGQSLESKIIVTPMGIDAQLFNPNKATMKIKKQLNIQGPFLLFIGSLVEKKGLLYLIQAMKKIKQKFPNAKLILIGGGPQETFLKETSKRLELDDSIRFLGPKQNIELPPYFASCDIFVSPSIVAQGGDTEGLPSTLVEAAMCGCAIITTEVGGISDLIKSGYNGLLISQKNPQTIYLAVNRLLTNKTLRLELKKNARFSTYRNYDWPIVVVRFVKLYNLT